LSVGRQYPQGPISTPTHAVSAPSAPTISLGFAPFGQFPVAHRPSVPCWLAGGSRAVSTSACEAGPSLDGLCPTAYSGQRVQRPSERASSLGPTSESQRLYPGPTARLPRARITGFRPPGQSLRYRGLRAPAHKLDAIDAFLSTAISRRREVRLAWAAASSPPVSLCLSLSLSLAERRAFRARYRRQGSIPSLIPTPTHPTLHSALPSPYLLPPSSNPRFRRGRFSSWGGLQELTST
jgi:hypothetical protein